MTLSGTWLKQTQSACSSRYPARINFGNDNLYTAQPDAVATVQQVWIRGSWSARGNQLTLSTANDTISNYTVILNGDLLMITTPDNCKLEYRKQ